MPCLHYLVPPPRMYCNSSRIIISSQSSLKIPQNPKSNKEIPAIHVLCVISLLVVLVPILLYNTHVMYISSLSVYFTRALSLFLCLCLLCCWLLCLAALATNSVNTSLLTYLLTYIVGSGSQDALSVSPSYISTCWMCSSLDHSIKLSLECA